MKDYILTLGKIINSLKGRTNVGKEDLEQQTAAYDNLLTAIAANVPAYTNSLGRYRQDVARINKNLSEGRTETAFLSLMISTGSLSGFLGTAMDYSEARSNR